MVWLGKTVIALVIVVVVEVVELVMVVGVGKLVMVVGRCGGSGYMWQ